MLTKPTTTKEFSNYSRFLWLFVAIVTAGAAVLWYYTISPYLLRIPGSFSYSAQVISHDNFYDTQAGRYRGEQESATTFSYSVQSISGKNAIVNNSVDVQTLAGQKIFNVERLYGINTYSGTHVPGLGDRTRDGFLFAPRMKGLAAQTPDKSSFIYWHVNYDVPARMTYRGQETIYGLPVYRYESDFIADQTQNLTNLPGVGTSLGVSVSVHLTLWIEPYSGQMVQYRDEAEAFYYNLQTKERLYPWNKFYNYFAPSSVASHAEQATYAKQRVILFGSILPVTLFSCAILTLLLFGLLHILDRKKTILPRPVPSNSGRLVSYSIVAVSVLIVIIAFIFLRTILAQQKISKFQSEANNITEGINSRLATYANVLRGGRGLFSASNSVEREEWKAYTASIDVQKDYPGVQGVGYAPCVSEQEKDVLVASIQAEGFSDFAVTPSGQREVYCPVLFLEPFDSRNQRAFGYDMFSEPVRKAAMDYARDSGEATISGKVTLVQENEQSPQAGFLMYEPLYKNGAPIDTPQQRRIALQGFVYSPFRVNDFMRAVLADTPSNIGVEIFDGSGVSSGGQERVMYTSSSTFADGLTSNSVITFGGHSFTLRYSAPKSFGASKAVTVLPWLVLFFGFLFCGLLFSIFKTMNTRRAVALHMAQTMTADLEKSRTELFDAKQTLQQKLDETQRLNNIMVDRELKMIELKEELQKYKK